VRKKYGERVQENRLEEERKLPELYFIDFYDYGKIIEANKRIFSSYTESQKEWNYGSLIFEEFFRVFCAQSGILYSSLQTCFR